MKNEEFEDDFKRVLDLYLKGRLSARQKMQVEKQLDEFKKKDEAPYEFNQQHADDLWGRISAKTIEKQPGNNRFWISVAAAVVFVSAAVLLTLSWNYDAIDPSNKVILADGTIVWLKDNASLGHSKLSPGNREVTLSGEALFEVARDREHPFVIHCGRYDVSVLGTSFNIKASDDVVELTVLTGTVKLSSTRTDKSVIVNPREHVIFSDSAINRSATPDESITSVIANTQYDMHFEDTRMEEVVKRVESKFDVHVVLESDDIGNCMISADFTDQSLPLTLAMISEALGFQYEINEGEVMITGTGCPD